MMISIGIFLIVITIGMESLLNASFIHQKSQDTRSVLDSLNFMMDDMSRSIRTGSGYSCIDSGGTFSASNCVGLVSAISFTASDGSNIAYSILPGGIVQKTTSSGGTVPLTDTAHITIGAGSGFTVSGAASGNADNLQPLVTIRLIGTITSKGTTTSFSLQTSVSQRAGDI
jgi:hypothetical protein